MGWSLDNRGRVELTLPIEKLSLAVRLWGGWDRYPSALALLTESNPSNLSSFLA